MHTCDHQTLGLGTKADHERRFALEEVFFRSKHPLFRREKDFSLTARCWVKFAELRGFCFDDASEKEKHRAPRIRLPKLPFSRRTCSPGFQPHTAQGPALIGSAPFTKEKGSTDPRPPCLILALNPEARTSNSSSQDFFVSPFPHTAGLHKGHHTANFALFRLLEVSRVNSAALRTTINIAWREVPRQGSLAMDVLQKTPSVMGVPMKHISLITVWLSTQMFLV
jgi:hypothetical protein